MQIYPPDLRRVDKPKLLLMAILLVLPVVLMLFSLQVSLRYHALVDLDHQYWRWFTGHWVHLSWGHLWMNWLALLILLLSFYNSISRLDCVLLHLCLPLLVSLAFILFSPELRWYVGLSGVLHGLFVYLLLKDKQLSKAIKSLFLVGLVIKLLAEQYFGPMPGSESMAGGNVVVDAHLYGAIAGLLYYLLSLSKVLINSPAE